MSNQEKKSEDDPSKNQWLAKERLREEVRLKESLTVIENNISNYLEQLKEISNETEELYDNYRSDNPELHNELVVSLDLKSQIERTLNKNLLARKKPYFGRIDYKEDGEDKLYSLYIGKNGITKGSSEIVIVDWRAPVSSVYYDSDIGRSSYTSPYGDLIPIELNLKRTFEIENGKLMDFYDTDVVANDEFLTKYLAKNKEVVLGEIIATIQKEQNEIIRDTPWHSVIVQGVAGSGKTTVAMHRISYILYNFKDKFHSDEFYIIGSNKILLNYITGVLPNLDVYNINQMTLEELMIHLLDKELHFKKNKYKLMDSFSKIKPVSIHENELILKRLKGSLIFIKALEKYLDEYERMVIPHDDFIYHDKVLYSKDDILEFFHTFKNKPLQEKIDMLNQRLASKIKLKNEFENKEKKYIKEEVKKYKYYFGKKNGKIDVQQIYLGFIQYLRNHREEFVSEGIFIPDGKVFELLLLQLEEKNIDIYDLCMMTFIKKRLKYTEEFDDVKHIVVDEAQDFGVLVFYVLRQLFKGCTFTIMGDVSQNIYYDSGMNDWEELRNDVFSMEKDKFYLLAKSYRNTVEISNYASLVLKKCSFKTYEIEPIIRHGKEVTLQKVDHEEEMVDETVKRIKEAQEAGYNTIAVICRTVEETLKVSEELSKHVLIEQRDKELEMTTFTNGIMVLPIHMTKGLEFDVVILWNPDEVSYQANDGEAKLLYVAITRALHELYIVYQGNFSKLLTQEDKN